MGVGVFSSDFDGTGGSFLVDGPLATEEEYAAYRQEAGEDALDHEMWAQDQYDSFNEDLVNSLEDALREIGFNIGERKGFRGDRASFDKDFVTIGDNDIIQAGWRSWEHDFVVGVGASSGWFDWMSDHEGQSPYIIGEKGRPAELVKRDYDVLSGCVEEYVRLRLIKDGFECRYRTSGYTTAAYSLPDDIAVRLETLPKTIAAHKSKLNQSFEDGVASLARHERVELLKELKREPDGASIEVPFYDAKENVVSLYDPDRKAFVSDHAVPEALAELFRSLPDEDGLAPVIGTDETEVWFAGLRAERSARGKLVVDAHEYGEVHDGEMTVEYSDGDENSEVTFTVPAEEPSLRF